MCTHSQKKKINKIEKNRQFQISNKIFIVKVSNLPNQYLKYLKKDLDYVKK